MKFVLMLWLNSQTFVGPVSWFMAEDACKIAGQSFRAQAKEQGHANTGFACLPVENAEEGEDQERGR